MNIEIRELVGSVCLDKGSPRVTEYSELGAELAERRADDGRLLFCAGSIANHLYSLEFLERFELFECFKAEMCNHLKTIGTS
ncbi:unnamed protein product [Strongylus vulgaris]|uniref:Uncharacterized protein n=1 Tax=Strongylus vulgaris TaxID=40348 RepID=A0A3P7K4A2_STRVU|nr:unnamed protein product [Strongylus vulgaris]